MGDGVQAPRPRRSTTPRPVNTVKGYLGNHSLARLECRVRETHGGQEGTCLKPMSELGGPQGL